jgi:hypothetical protein
MSLGLPSLGMIWVTNAAQMLMSPIRVSKLIVPVNVSVDASGVVVGGGIAVGGGVGGGVLKVPVKGTTEMVET